MDGARLSRFPHLTWLRFRVTGDATSRLVVTTHGACHTISLTARGRHDVRWITRGREQRWSETTGAVHVVPADGEQHTFLTTMSPDFVSQVLLLPRAHLQAFALAEGCTETTSPRRLLAHDDALLRACVARLGAGDGPDDPHQAWRHDEVARRLVLRILELMGGGRPDWHDDASVFEARMLLHLVERIDEQLLLPPTLGDMALLVGLSPSHFAGKFRRSTGLSFHRFVNRRRIGAALEALKDRSRPLAHVALDLGFSSQSHFTRLFSGLTGMTPARYRRQFRHTVG